MKKFDLSSLSTLEPKKGSILKHAQSQTKKLFIKQKECTLKRHWAQFHQNPRVGSRDIKGST